MDLRDRVREFDAVVGFSRRAEAGDVNAEQLQLRRCIRALEGRITATQPVGKGASHGIAGRDQAVDPTGVAGHLANGGDRRIGGQAMIIDHDATALPERQTCRLGQLMAGTDTSREHHKLSVEYVAIFGAEPTRSTGVVHDVTCHEPEIGLDVEIVDPPGQHGGRWCVELLRHQPLGHLDHRRLQAQVLHCVRRFETEQPTPDHDTRCHLGLFGVGPNRFEVLKGSVDETARKVRARQGWNKRIRTGGQHQMVVVEVGAVIEQDQLLRSVDGGHGNAKPEVHTRRFERRLITEVEILEG